MARIASVSVKGVNWKIYFSEEDKFVKRFGEGIAALCILENKAIYFHDGEVEKPIVIHELVHAYWADMCLSSTTLTNGQLEEVWADMFARFGPTIIRQSNKLYKKLKELT